MYHLEGGRLNLRRLIIDAHACKSIIKDSDALLNAMLEGAQLSGAEVRDQLASPFVPHGATLVLVLAESHFVVSTWPELDFASLDAALCNDKMDIKKLVQPLMTLLDPGRVEETLSCSKLADQ